MMTHILRTGMKIYIWKKLVDPPLNQIKLEFFFGFWLFLAEVAWQIYGNTFIYDENIDHCKEDAQAIVGDRPKVENLRITCLVLIFFYVF